MSRQDAQDPSFRRRYSLPFEDGIDGEAQIHYAAELDRCAIIAPNGDVTIGESHLSQCVIVEPCHIGDGVRAVAAILQGRIEDGVTIEAHADIMGTVMEGSIVRRGVVIEHGALVGPDSEIGDLTTIDSEAEVGSNVEIGAQSHIGAHSFVADNTRLPSRTVIRPGAYAVETAATSRQRDSSTAEPSAGFRIIDEPNDTAELYGEETQIDELDEPEPKHSRDYIPAALSTDRSAKPGDMARGTPRLLTKDFRPGTARSWVISKLGRLANLKTSDGRLTKKLVQEFRPDLLEHAVTKELLRVTPPLTDERLAEMSFEALSPARYDVYGNISFHSGSQPDWQMIGPQANDVFVFAVPQDVIREIDGTRGELHEAFPKPSEWHPDRLVTHPVGWVRMVVVPPRYVFLVEIQSDQPWMKFHRRHGGNRVEEALREMYFHTFASDAMNFVVEWAFAHRYSQVIVLDYASRKLLGGSPPKSFYDDVPKKYTVSPLLPLDDFPIPTFEWLDRKKMMVRRIVPNRRLR